MFATGSRIPLSPTLYACLGEMSERPKEHAWKVCVLVRVPWVRIPLSPFSPLAAMARPRAIGWRPTPSDPEGSSGKQSADVPRSAWPELKGFFAKKYQPLAGRF